MWQVMKNAEPSVFVNSNEEGVARVIKEYRNVKKKKKMEFNNT